MVANEYFLETTIPFFHQDCEEISSFSQMSSNKATEWSRYQTSTEAVHPKNAQLCLNSAFPTCNVLLLPSINSTFRAQILVLPLVAPFHHESIGSHFLRSERSRPPSDDQMVFWFRKNFQVALLSTIFDGRRSFKLYSILCSDQLRSSACQCLTVLNRARQCSTVLDSVRQSKQS